MRGVLRRPASAVPACPRSCARISGFRRRCGCQGHLVDEAIFVAEGEALAAEQVRIVALLVERIDIGTDGLDIRLRVDGLTSLAREMMASDRGAAA